uniref:Putative adenylyl-sulfate kinase n=1 Tax=viral metagenome TaxID=1070528 RepID=A0A6H1ZVX2_9ZZZZ
MIIWLCGKSGAGKSTLAGKLSRILNAPVIDADVHRNPKYGWSLEDRNKSCHDLAGQAARLEEKNPIVIVSAIAPYAGLRKELYWINFIQVDHVGSKGRDDDAEFEHIDGLEFNITL